MTPNPLPGYLLRGQHGAEAADGPGVLLRRLLHLQQLCSLHQWLQHLAGPAVLQPLRPQPLLQLADVVPAETEGSGGCTHCVPTPQKCTTSPWGDQPELDAAGPGAGILPQQQVVEGGAADEEEELAQDLVAHGWGQPLASQELEEGAQLLQELGQGVGSGGRGPVEAGRAGGGQALDGFALQHCGNWRVRKKKGEKKKKKVGQSKEVLCCALL